MVLYIIALFLAKSFVTYGVMFLVLCACHRPVQGGPVKSILRGLKPVLFIVVFTAVLKPAVHPRRARAGQAAGSLPSPWRACSPLSLWCIRIMLLIAGTFLLTYTTSPHPAHRRAGVPAGAAEEDQGAGA